MSKIRPNYYVKYKYEPRLIISDWDLNFNLGSVIKYISRAGNKEGESKKQDLEKAKQYIDFELEKLEEESNDLSHMFEESNDLSHMFEGQRLDCNWESWKRSLKSRERQLKMNKFISGINNEKSISPEIEDDGKLYYLKLKIDVSQDCDYLTYFWWGWDCSYYSLSTKSFHDDQKFKRSEYPEIAKKIGTENLLDFFNEEEVEEEA